MDLSLCDNIEIPIKYKIKNTSILKLNEASYFKNMGIDFFNLEDEFFNDICYPYSDNNKSSNMILSDVLIIFIKMYPYVEVIVNINHLIMKQIALIVYAK